MDTIEQTVDESIKTVTNEDIWINIGTVSLKIFLIIVVSFIVVRVGKLMIRNIFSVRVSGPIQLSERRQATLLKLLENTLTYVIYFMSFIMILSNLGVNVQGLLAGAGVVGLAVGFGAQSLVKDIITGFFIIFEDQFSVGDFVRIGAFEGVVEEIGLRRTKLKSYTGEIHMIPNGSIIEVTNFSINNSRAVVDVSISYQGDIGRAENAIQALIENMDEQYEEMVGPPELLGIQNILASEVVIRVVAETLPMQQHYIARVLRKEIKQVLDENGIESPYPKLVMYSRSDQQA